ncbi:hypothetical protein OAM92_00300, partial [Acidimicrobiales bacterium]|nr:hypothetical protein [Acidimicrobiales bacterium]
RLKRQREEVKEGLESLDEKELEWDIKVEALAEREKALKERLQTVTAAELEAETGFADKEHGLYEEFRAKTDAIRVELTEAAASIAASDTDAILDRLGQLRSFGEELERSSAVRITDLTKQSEELDQERQSAIVQRREDAAERRQFEWDQEDTKKENERSLAAERASYEVDRLTWEAEQQQLLADLKRVATRKAELEQREREAKFVNVAQLEEDRDELRSELRNRDDELARRPPEEEHESLRRTQKELESRLLAMTELLDKNQRLASQLESTRSELAQLELAEVKNENLRQEKAVLASEVNELRTALGDLTGRRDERKPFQLCSSIDDDDHLQASTDPWAPAGDLAELVEYLSQTMASKNLYYDEVTIRAFLAGMHSSTLHVLQGISGTGKSSLPQAVADALGIECPIIEVQAAWRDRQDLLGYFNPFEHRFEETPFTVALYRAQSPRHRNSPFFVLLDEMNLSHPEQYLADVLSAMERPEGDRALRLMNHVSDQAPQGLRDGMLLPLPPNVWIIGTANHDETTVSFAPKTYDRSHVFELPMTHPKPSDGIPRQDTGPVSLTAINALFSIATERNRSGATTRALEFLHGLRPQLAAMHVGWGNRIDQQLERYAPVVTGADGTVREAVDVFVAYKILNKLEGRYDFRPGDLKLLRELVDDLWPDLPGKEDPERINAVLDREEARRG